MEKSNMINFTKGLLYTVLALFLVGTLINCGGNSSGPVQVQAPKAFIQDYVAKHGTMVDTSLASLYVNDEQPKVAADIKRIISSNVLTCACIKIIQGNFLRVRHTVEKHGKNHGRKYS